MGGIDSMAKNMYLTRFSKDNKWYPQFYDMDTSFGINNQGKLKFGENTIINVLGRNNYGIINETIGSMIPGEEVTINTNNNNTITLNVPVTIA